MMEMGLLQLTWKEFYRSSQKVCSLAPILRHTSTTGMPSPPRLVQAGEVAHSMIRLKNARALPPAIFLMSSSE